jgi:hypothetical protein
MLPTCGIEARVTLPFMRSARDCCKGCDEYRKKPELCPPLIVIGSSDVSVVMTGCMRPSAGKP